jgi:hypothetical protein
MQEMRDWLENEIISLQDEHNRYLSDLYHRLEEIVAHYLDMRGIAEGNSYDIREYLRYDRAESGRGAELELVPVDDTDTVDVIVLFSFILVSAEEKEVEITVVEYFSEGEEERVIIEPTRISELAHVDNLPFDPMHLGTMLVYTHEEDEDFSS